MPISDELPAALDRGRDGLAYAAERSGLHAHSKQIVLEITERGVPDQLGLKALDLLARRGVRLALDDTARTWRWWRAAASA